LLALKEICQVPTLSFEAFAITPVVKHKVGHLGLLSSGELTTIEKLKKLRLHAASQRPLFADGLGSVNKDIRIEILVKSSFK